MSLIHVTSKNFEKALQAAPGRWNGKSQRLEIQIFIFLIASFLLIKNIFEFWHLFPGARALLRKAKFLRQNIIAFIPLCIRYIRFR